MSNKEILRDSSNFSLILDGVVQENIIIFIGITLTIHYVHALRVKLHQEYKNYAENF